MAKSGHTALICPLDWGLGHASRLIPVVHELERAGYHIILSGSGLSLSLLRHEFPSLPYLDLPGFTARYAKNPFLVPFLLLRLPRMMLILFREHRQVKAMVEKHKIDLVISDNRYGLFCRNARTVLITHQLSPRLPAGLRWSEYPLHLLLRYLVRRFDACWIPDLPSTEASISGMLSHRYRLPSNARFIGILSRFSQYTTCKGPKESRQRSSDNPHHAQHSGPELTPNTTIPNTHRTHTHRTHILTHTHEHNHYKVVIVLSGPEPQRTILFELLLEQAGETGLKTLFICGLVANNACHGISGRGSGSNRCDSSEGIVSLHGQAVSELSGMAGNGLITCVPHLPAEVFFEILVSADVILCRPGYSSLMDLAAAGRTAILVPTPGQTEQEYLAAHVSSRYGFVHFSQKGFSLGTALDAYRMRENKCLLPFPVAGTDLLSGAIRQIEGKYTGKSYKKDLQDSNCARQSEKKYQQDDDKAQDKS